MVRSHIVLFMVAVATLLLGSSAPVSAHVQNADNGVSAVMHILPDDSPVAAKLTQIQFTFGGSTEDFSTAACACTLEVRRGSGETTTSQLTPVTGTGTTANTSVTFPREGVYDLTVKSLTGRPFAITFVVRVDPAGGARNVAGGIDVVFISVASLAIIAVLAYYTIAGGERYTAGIKKT